MRPWYNHGSLQLWLSAAFDSAASISARLDLSRDIIWSLRKFFLRRVSSLAVYIFSQFLFAEMFFRIFVCRCMSFSTACLECLQRSVIFFTQCNFFCTIIWSLRSFFSTFIYFGLNVIPADIIRIFLCSSHLVFKQILFFSASFIMSFFLFTQFFSAAITMTFLQRYNFLSIRSISLHPAVLIWVFTQCHTLQHQINRHIKLGMGWPAHGPGKLISANSHFV